MLKLSKREVRLAQREDDPWRIGNDILYDLCRTFPRHVNDAEIIAKVLLIGRVYAATIERGRGDSVGANVSGDVFYTEHVTKAFRNSELDGRLKSLAKFDDIDESSVSEVLDTHGYFVTVLKRLTHKEKRSFASKYLHFHRPKLFFLFDSRAVDAIRKLDAPAVSIPSRATADRQYAKFVSKALGLRQHIATTLGAKLTLRELDRVLLAVAGQA